MSDHSLDFFRPGMQVFQLVSKLLLWQRGDLILRERIQGAAFPEEDQVVLQRQFTHVFQRIASFEKFAGHSNRIDERILEKLKTRLTGQVLIEIVQRVAVEPETVARVERWVSWFGVRASLSRCGSWVDLFSRCRRRRRGGIGGLWQGLQTRVRSGEG